MSVVPASDEPPAPAAFDALTALLPAFEDPAFSPGTWREGKDEFPWFAHSPVLNAFVEAAYDGGWVVSFDWMHWEEGSAYTTAPTRLATADVATVRRLITMHIRADRFTEGHLAAVAADGTLLALLRRLRELRPT